MYRYKLKEDSYTPKGFEIGDVEITKGRKSTVTDVDPKTGAVSWDIEHIAAFESIYKTFDKLRGLLKILEKEGEAKDDTTIDNISSETNNLFNEFRTHVRKKYPEAYKRLLRLKEGENVNEGWRDELRNYIDKFFEDHRSRVPEGQKHLVVYFDEFINWTKENRVPKNLVTSLLQNISNEESKGFLIDVDFKPLEEEEGIGYMTPNAFDKNYSWEKVSLQSIKEEEVDEGEGIGYLTPDAFDKNKKSTGASDIYYYKLGFKPVPKKIKGAGTIVKQLWEKESLNEFSDFQQKRINSFDEIEENLNQVSPLLSNAKSETTKYYNENPGSYDIKYSTDMIEDYVNNIIELLKQEEE